MYDRSIVTSLQALLKKIRSHSTQANQLFFIVVMTTGFLLIIPSPLIAEKYRNQYMECELPDGWVFRQEGSEIVGQSKKENSTESIIVIAAKLRGPQDTLAAYLKHLQTPKEYKHEGENITSTIIYCLIVKINGQTWVDAVHRNGEIHHFTTRYLARIEGNVAVLVTYSAISEKYDEYTRILSPTVNTMKVFQPEDTELNQTKS